MSKKTVFIVGSSSGIGEAIAKHFSKKGWNVAAVMRNTDSSELKNLDNVLVLKGDTKDENSIGEGLKKCFDHFGSIDVLVNNSGYGLFGPLEGMSIEQIKEEFDVNIIGLINNTRLALPYLRKNKESKIINISSMFGRMTLPFTSMYASTKWAIEGFSESLAFELDPYNIKVKLIQPGSVKTKFFSNEVIVEGSDLGVYKKRFNKVLKYINNKGENGVPAEMVAKKVWRATNSNSNRLRYEVDITARFLIKLHLSLIHISEPTRPY